MVERSKAYDGHGATDGASASGQSPLEPHDLLDKLRRRMTDVCLYVFASILPVVLLGSLYRAVDGGFKPVMYFHLFAALVFLLIAMLRKRIHYRVRAYVVVMLLYAAGIWGLLTWGLFSGGNLLLSTSCLFATLLLGTRHGVVMLVATTLAWGALTWRAYTGNVVWNEALATYAVAHASWLSELLGGGLFTLLPILAISYVERALMEKASESLSHSRALERAHEKVVREMEITSAIIDGLPGLFYLIDRSGRLVRWNAAFEKYFDVESAQAGDAQVLDLIPERSRGRAAAVLESGFSMGSLEAELTLPLAGGTESTIYLTGTRFVRGDEELLLGVGLDITRQRAMELERRQLATVVEQTDESIMIMNPQGRIVYINPAFERMTGYTISEAAGASAAMLESGAHEPAWYRGLWTQAADGAVWRGRLVERCKDGSLISVDAIISSIRDETGEVLGYVVVRRDVSEQVRLERELQQNQRMNAIGTLAGGIAHDFNNILGAIMGYTELLREDLSQESEERREWLLAVGDASLRARDIVRQILLFSRQSHHERKPVDFAVIVREALTLIRSALPKSIEIREELGDQVLRVLADSTQLHQVVMNLCTNAWHAMRARGGVITVSLGTTTIEEGDSVSPGTYAVLTIADTGAGVAPENLERIFEPFFTTKPQGEGTGLGLSVVHGIVSEHGGTIRVSSEPGAGAKFSVFIPQLTSGANESRVELPPAARGTECVVLVDDEPALLGVYSRVLNGLGYRTLVHDHPVRALEWIRANTGNFDLLVTDFSMPEMTGTELCEAIRSMGLDCPVILCTGYLGEVPAELLEACQVDIVLQKPLELRKFCKIVREALDHRPEHTPVIRNRA